MLNQICPNLIHAKRVFPVQQKNINDQNTAVELILSTLVLILIIGLTNVENYFIIHQLTNT